MPDYGNVPTEDVEAIYEAVRVAKEVSQQLPAGSPPEWQNISYETILGGILDDWVANGSDDLDDDDIGDLVNLLRASADIALQQPVGLRDSTFQIVLQHAMNDWVENWNLED